MTKIINPTDIFPLKEYNYTFFTFNIPYSKRNQPSINKRPPIGVIGPKKDTLNPVNSLDASK